MQRTSNQGWMIVRTRKKCLTFLYSESAATTISDSSRGFSSIPDIVSPRQEALSVPLPDLIPDFMRIRKRYGHVIALSEISTQRAQMIPRGISALVVQIGIPAHEPHTMLFQRSYGIFDLFWPCVV